MSENAPLSNAHAHARKAADETQQTNWSNAAHEHQSSATHYAKAARETSDSEALRILRLLEDQHLKLARLIRTQDASEQQVVQPLGPAKSADAAVSQHVFATVDQQHSETSPPAKSATSALATARLGGHARDSSPSLARDIASRRGIPQPGRNPPSAAAQARARQLSPESHRRNRSSTTPKIPPSVMDSQTSQKRTTQSVEEDDAFAKFYSNLTTGTMSKLSSVLAYAGLPLTPEETPPEPPSKQKLKRTVSASNEPDVTKYFSKAALNAIEDEHRQRGNQGHVFGPAESFYVVQTGGGTYSYADIAKAHQQSQLQGQLGGIDEDDEEAFVDAREAQAPSSPKHSRSGGSQHQSRTAFGRSRTHEELELENTTLKTTLEQLATRLADFETHAQDASMAMAQSMAGITHAPQAAGGSQPDLALVERLRQLERQLDQQTEERQKLQNLAAKQEKTLKQYKNKWEDIKKSAREKERAKKERSEKAEAATSSNIADERANAAAENAE